MINNKSKERYLLVFILGVVTSAIFFLPFLIKDQGVFVFFGDYTVQQIPFYQHAHDMIRSGSMAWDFGTDLGVNFIGSYSFYLLGSPFFWLTIPFPSAAVPYLMAPLFWLKYGVAAVTAYGFVRRFVKNKDYAVLAGLLYAFSGFNIYNIFFNHFNEVVAFFPLLLIGLEELMENGRKGPFLLAVFLNAITNYFFFVGQVVFLCIYFIIRAASCRQWKVSFGKVVTIAFESIIGVGMACIILMPAALAILDNPRLDSSLYGYNMVLYSNEQRYPAILQSFLFPPELPSRPNFFPDHNAKWSSMAGWFPLISLSGVIAYMSAKKKNWLKTIMVVLIVMAFVPILNSAFFAFNAAYYARWFYMPILLFALASVKALEDRRINFIKGIRWTFILTAVMVVIVGFLPASNKDGKITYGLAKYPERFWAYSIIALVSLIVLVLLIKFLRGHKNFIWITTSVMLSITVVSSIVYIGEGKACSPNSQWIVDNLIETKLELPETPNQFFRTDTYKSTDNLPMFWGYSSINAFHSIVPRSVLDFYPTIGTKRSVGSRPETDVFALRGLTSVKYLIAEEGKGGSNVLPGFTFFKKSNGVNVYQNDYYVPMGFTYDKYITQNELMAAKEEDRDKIMMKAMVLENNASSKYTSLLKHAAKTDYTDVSKEAYLKDCNARKANTCYSFTIDPKGFTGKINLSKSNLVFFSVPYEKGWSATVNGQPVDILKANVGFMAVSVPQGEAEIRFVYTTPGLQTGIIITVICTLIAAVYIFFTWRYRKKHAPATTCAGCCDYCQREDSYRDYDSEQLPDTDEIGTAEEYRQLQQEQNISPDNLDTGSSEGKNNPQ